RREAKRPRVARESVSRKRTESRQELASVVFFERSRTQIVRHIAPRLVLYATKFGHCAGAEEVRASTGTAAVATIQLLVRLRKRSTSCEHHAGDSFASCSIVSCVFSDVRDPGAYESLEPSLAHDRGCILG